MYAFVDQPVCRLAPAGRFLLWAMRGWIHAASQGKCPPGQLAPAFAKTGALPVLPHFHRLLCALNRHGVGEIAFAPLDHDRVTEDEAVLLQLWRDALVAPPRARATLALLIEAGAAGDGFEALLAAASGLHAAAIGDVALAGHGGGG